jgi:hypothetical protein
VTRSPFISPAAWVNRRRRDDITAVAAKIDSLCEPGAISKKKSGMRKIQVSAAATGYHFGRDGEGAVLAL